VDLPESGGDEAESGSEEDDIEAQIRKEIEGLKPSTSKKSSLFEAVKFDLPCST
jgi:tRNA acetyltransferase TAN1